MRRSTRLCALILTAYVTFVAQLWIRGIRSAPGGAPADSSSDPSVVAAVANARGSAKSGKKRSRSHPLLPSCHPHWTVSASAGRGVGALRGNALPITRIHFYHVRKAGGSMIRNYLVEVASRYGIDLEMQEFVHAFAREEVGSRNDTIYVTNLRDPVERSISHFKYDGRWDCRQMVYNASYVATEDNARPLKAWNETGGFEPSPCGFPFSFESCAVNCYVQTFSGRGCTDDGWATEYNLAMERLLRYNLILVSERFNDPRYVEAVEGFFGGVGGFNEYATMFCGVEAYEANERVPLVAKFEDVLELTRLNDMDNRLYKDLVTSCWDEGEAEYSFPRVNTSRFVAQENRTIIE